MGPSPVLVDPNFTDGCIRSCFSPYEGAVGAPEGESAGSLRRYQQRDLPALQHRGGLRVPARAVAPRLPENVSALADYKLDNQSGAPSFVDEQPGDAIRKHPGKSPTPTAYVVNVARWLADKARARRSYASVALTLTVRGDCLSSTQLYSKTHVCRLVATCQIRARLRFVHRGWRESRNVHTTKKKKKKKLRPQRRRPSGGTH